MNKETTSKFCNECGSQIKEPITRFFIHSLKNQDENDFEDEVCLLCYRNDEPDTNPDPQIEARHRWIDG